MKINDKYSITLDNFEGPLEFLLYLVQKSEIDLNDVRLHKITDHFIAEMKSPDLNLGAEFIGTLASLIWLKSKLLLPKHEQIVASDDEEGLDPHFNVIHQLIDYCHFKEAGKVLITLEEQQNAFFPRGVTGDFSSKLPSGVSHLSLEDLAHLFQEAIQKAEGGKGSVHEEEFLVSDKISFLKKTFQKQSIIYLEEILTKIRMKEELIVLFLAILELMKIGKTLVCKEAETGKVYLKDGND